MGEPTPEERGKLKVQKRERRKAKSLHRTYQFPKWVLDGLCKHRSSRNHFAIVLRLEELWFIGNRLDSNLNPVILTKVSVGGRKMARKEKYLALLDLKHWGWISVELSPGRASLVTLKWRAKQP
jgi:hypothetical protein